MMLRPRPVTRSEKVWLLPLVVMLAVAAWMGAMGCGSRHYIDEPNFSQRPIQQVTLAKLTPGQQLSRRPDQRWTYELLQVRVARSKAWFGWIDAYEVLMQSDSKVPSRVWIYVYDKMFIRWGPPGEWPTEHDVVKLIP